MAAIKSAPLPDIKPCPSCKREPSIITDEAFALECIDCGIRVERPTFDEALDEWNGRAALPMSPAAFANMVYQLEREYMTTIPGDEWRASRSAFADMVANQ